MAGERLIGSALAAPSAALSIGRAPSFGPKPGSFESVKFLNPGSFPIKGGDSKTLTLTFRFEPLRPRPLNALRAQKTPAVEPNIIKFPESRQAKPVDRVQPRPAKGEIIFFPKIRPLEIRPVPQAVPVPVEYQRLAARIRLAQRLMSARQTRVIAGPEISAYARTGTGPATRQGVAGESRIAVLKSTRPQIEPQVVRRAEGSRLVQTATPSALEKLKRKVVEITAVDKDHKTNQARKEALKKAFDAIHAETGEDQVDGSLLGYKAGIEDDLHKSEYFSQIGEPQRTDYSQTRTRIRLQKGPIHKAEIPEIVEEFTAIRRAKDPVDAPTSKQFEQVVRPTDHFFADSKDEWILRKELVYEDLRAVVGSGENRAESLPEANVPSTNEEDNPALSGASILPAVDIFAPVRLLSLNPLDSRVDNSIDIFERRVA